MALSVLETVDYPKTIIIDGLQKRSTSITNKESRNTTVLQVLPFRIRFTNIGIDPAGYTPINPAPIGIAILGYNNYIL